MQITKDQLKQELEEVQTKIIAASVKCDDDPFFKCKKVRIMSKSLVQDKVLIIDEAGSKEAQIPIGIIKDVEKFNDEKDITQYIITTTDNQKIIISVAV